MKKKLVRKQKYKFMLQETDYDCGVAALGTALANVDVVADYHTLSSGLNLTPDGVDYDKIYPFLKGFLKEKNVSVSLFESASLEDLKREVTNGKVCLVLYQGWGEEFELQNLECGHYAVVVEYKEGKILLLDPSVYEDWGDGLGTRVMNEDEFAKRWVDTEDGKIIKGWMISLYKN